MQRLIEDFPADSLQRTGSLILFLLSLATLPSSALGVTLQADLTVSRLFSDHMVLQRNSDVTISGTAAAGSKIDVLFAGKEQSCVVGEDGKWKMTLPISDAGGPFDLGVKSGETAISFADVMIGDVWLCSGQSNMEWPLSQTEFGERDIQAAAELGNIRLLTIEQNASITPLERASKIRGWSLCTPQSVENFSAVAFYFAKKYKAETGVPVGVVLSAWGGTPCEAWTEYSAIQDEPALKSLADRFREVEPRAEPSFPGSLYNAMISPLVQIRFAGVLWYQGESNVARAAEYRPLFSAMVRNWRTRLNGGRGLPFYFVQIAPYRYQGLPETALAELWDSQLKVFRMTADCGMVVTTDLGDFADIHPRMKSQVGERLAAWAVNSRLPEESAAATAGAGIVKPLFSGPIYSSHKVIGDTMEIRFDFAGTELASSDGEALREFTICGENREFVPARAIILGNRVVVSAENVRHPVAVRFCWRDTPNPNLVNEADLPASPFRTDEFALTSETAGK